MVRSIVSGATHPSVMALLVVKPTGEKTLLYQNLASISTNIKPMKIDVEPRFTVFVCVKFESRVGHWVGMEVFVFCDQ